MSKPIARVAVFLVISLALIAATYMTVQGSWLKTNTNNISAQVQSHTVAGLQTNLNHDRLSSSEVQTLQMNNFVQPGGGAHQNGGCHSDTHTAPQD
jgi:hypothetical protein